MSRPRRALSTVSLPDGLYIIGGYDGREYLSLSERFEINTKKMQRLPDMHIKRGTFCGITSCDLKYIYAVGGFNGSPLNMVERFDLLKG